MSRIETVAADSSMKLPLSQTCMVGLIIVRFEACHALATAQVVHFNRVLLAGSLATRSRRKRRG